MTDREKGLSILFRREITKTRSVEAECIEARETTMFWEEMTVNHDVAGSATRRSSSCVVLCARHSLTSKLALWRTPLAKTCHRHLFAALTQQGEPKNTHSKECVFFYPSHRLGISSPCEVRCISPTTAEPLLYLITRQRVFSCSLMIYNTSF